MMNSRQTHYPPPHLPRRGRKPVARSRAPLWLMLGGAALLVMTGVLAMIAVLAALALQPERIASGVSVASVELGRVTAEEAERRLQALTSQTIITTDGSQSFPLTLADLGATVDVGATLAAAQDARPNTALLPQYIVDLNQAQQGLIALSEKTNVDAVPGDPPQMGQVLDIPVMLDRLRVDAAGELSDGTLELSMVEVEPPPQSSPNRSATQTTTHVVERGQELGLIARMYGVAMEDIVALNNLSNPDLLYVGQELAVPAAGIYTPSAAQAPPAPTTQGKAILVSTGEQRIYAYENGQLVRTHLVSTGLPATPTVMGDYKVYVKYEADDMSGADYFLPQVPYTMYFYQGYAIHGTYWHNSFGRPMSHGCVNLPTTEAEWFFNWAEVGTPVRVI